MYFFQIASGEISIKTKDKGRASLIEMLRNYGLQSFNQ